MATVKHLCVCVGVALALGACEPADPPASPSFAQDVLPVMNAHCVRCHGANGELNGDSSSTYPGFRTKAETGYLNQYENTVEGEKITRYGARALAGDIKTYVHATPDMRMPPLPAGLSDWELKLIDNWVGAPGSTPRP